MPRWIRLFRSQAWVVLALAAVVSSGCDSNDFVPPPPPELQGALGAAPGSPIGTGPGIVGSPSGSGSIELILNGGHDAEETEVLKSAARSQAGLEKVRLRTVVPSEDPAAHPGVKATGPSSQAELVRQAAARHPQALIVEPADRADQALADSIHEAQVSGVPIVLLGHSLSVEPVSRPETHSKPLAPLILVAPQPFKESAREVVAAAIRNAKNAKLAPETGAILLIHTAADPFVEDRALALGDALKAAGVTSIKELRFTKRSDPAQKLLTDSLRADTKPVLVFSVDRESTTAGSQTVNEILEERPFILAGYTSEENLSRMTQVGHFAALAEFAPVRLVRKAVTTAVAAAHGKSLPPRVDLPLIVHESPPKAGLATIQSFYKTKKARESESKR
jgi:ABC-type sugar transport system substrate-binding protein